MYIQHEARSSIGIRDGPGRRRYGLVRVFEVDYGDDTYFIEDNDFGLVGRAILIVGGLAILFKRHKGNYYAVGIYALTLGLSRVIRSLPGLVAESNFMFYMSLIFLVVGGNLAWGGYNHLTVKTRNPATMRYTAWPSYCCSRCSWDTWPIRMPMSSRPFWRI